MLNNSQFSSVVLICDRTSTIMFFKAVLKIKLVLDFSLGYSEILVSFSFFFKAILLVLAVFLETNLNF